MLLEASPIMLDIRIAANMKVGSVELRNQAEIAGYFDGLQEDFAKAIQIVHRKTVLEILTYLIRITPVVTGRLRGSWTPAEDVYKFSGLKKWMKETSLAPQKAAGKLKQFSEAAVEEGKRQGIFNESGMNTTIGTNVSYAADVNARHNFIARSMVWGNKRYNDVMLAFIAAVVRGGQVPKVSLNDEKPIQ
jgi:hypothetical protein